MGIVGWVRNRRDGRVEILAAGPPEIVDLFEREIERGPSYGRVDGVEAVDLPADGTAFHSFEVRSTV